MVAGDGRLTCKVTEMVKQIRSVVGVAFPKSSCRKTTMSAGAVIRIFAALVLCVGFSNRGFAADLGLMPNESPPNYDWSGLYIGIDAAYRLVEASTSVTSGGNQLSTPLNSNGVAGSLVGGYNWEMPNFWNSGSMILGAEVDVIGSDAKQTNNFALGTESFANSIRVPWLVTTRGRFGVPFGPRDTWLAYMTGGVGFGRFESTSIISGPVRGLLNGTESRASWVVGGGLEYGFSRYWGWKTEYLYAETGSVTDTTPALPGGITYSTHRVTQQIIRSGINYHF
jgi:outer membrane immunogenic protein